MDDSECDVFIQTHFDDEFYGMYKALPFGVMKADVWRVAVLYIHGGIYADTDCECMVPVTAWMNPEHKLILSQEHPTGEIANFAFAAEPNHPALKCVLDLFLDLYKRPNFLDPTVPTPIQNFGQYGFSHGMMEYCKHAVDNYNIKVFQFHEHKFTNGVSPNNYITHYVASMRWKRDYDSWRIQQKKVLGK